MMIYINKPTFFFFLNEEVLSPISSWARLQPPCDPEVDKVKKLDEWILSVNISNVWLMKSVCVRRVTWKWKLLFFQSWFEAGQPQTHSRNVQLTNFPFICEIPAEQTRDLSV